MDEATGEPLPAAVLPYGGRSLLEGLVRDLQAREYVHFKLHGRQVTTPVAVMTSDAKGNHRRISGGCCRTQDTQRGPADAEVEKVHRPLSGRSCRKQLARALCTLTATRACVRAAVLPSCEARPTVVTAPPSACAHAVPCPA